MDINLPGMSGIECVARLRAAMPALKIIMLTVFEESEQVFKALSAGAFGYLVKSVRPARIIEAIREVHTGGSPMSGNIARKVVQTFHAQAARSDETTPPFVTDNCGVTLTPSAPVISTKPTCEGTRTYTYTYTDCEGNAHNWVYTYTVEYQPFADPVDGSAIIACASAAVAPALPVVNDNCNNLLSPTGPPQISAAPDCEGDITYLYTFVDCEGNTQNWKYTYTIEYADFTITAAPGASTVACPNATDVVPSPPVVTDNCGVTLTTSAPVISTKPLRCWVAYWRVASASS